MRAVAGILVAVALAGAGQTPVSQEMLLARLAIELAAERDVAPVSLDPDGSGLHGVAYDRFTRAHLAARVAKLKGSPLDPLKPPDALLVRSLVVVAVPLVCGDRTVRPTEVDIAREGRLVPRWQAVTGSAIQTLLPGATVPAGAIAVQFSDKALVRDEVVRISYDGAVCAGSSKGVALSVSATEPRVLGRPLVEMRPGEPAPSGPVTLDISGVVDLDGRLRYATAAEAATAFGAAALAAALKMRFEPARINRSPAPWTAGVVVTFAAVAALPSAASGTTTDVPALSAASSQCPVSVAALYGVTAINAIRIGGGMDGARREQQFLGVLRGPAGQGLKYESVGSVLAGGRGGTMLDRFEIRYAGLAQPVHIYFDRSREAPLMAPKGFTCAAPIVVK